MVAGCRLALVATNRWSQVHAPWPSMKASRESLHRSAGRRPARRRRAPRPGPRRRRAGGRRCSAAAPRSRSPSSPPAPVVPSLGQALLHDGAGPLQRALDRHLAGPEEVAVALADQPSTSRAMNAARCRGGRCWSAARNASSMVSRCTTVSPGSTSLSSRSGTAPATARPLPPASALGADGVHDVERQDPPAAAPSQRVQAGVGRDPVQPGPRRGAGVDPAGASPGLLEGLLEEVLGLVERSQHPVAVDQEPAGAGRTARRTAPGLRPGPRSPAAPR